MITSPIMSNDSTCVSISLLIVASCEYFTNTALNAAEAGDTIVERAFLKYN